MNTKRLFLLLIVFYGGVFSGTPLFGRTFAEEELPIVVKHIQEWSEDYLSVANNWNGMLCKVHSGELPPLLSVITSINGKDAKGMSVSDFNDVLMHNEKASLQFIKKEKGVNVEGHCNIQFHKQLFWPEGMNLSYPEAFPDNITIKVKKGIHFFDYNTFAYLMGSQTGIDERALFDVAARSLSAKGLAKIDNNDADIMLAVSTGKDQWNGTTVILELLDGKKLKDNIRQSLWSLEIGNLRKSLNESLSTIKSAINKYCANYPFEIPSYSHELNTLGIAFASQESYYRGEVIDVLQGSDAYKKGLRGGDVIRKAYKGGEWGGVTSSTRRVWFNNKKKPGQKNWGVDLFLIFPIIPHYKKNESDHYLITYYPLSAWSKNHFLIQKSHGSKEKIDAPFEIKTYNYTYIR